MLARIMSLIKNTPPRNILRDPVQFTSITPLNFDAASNIMSATPGTNKLTNITDGSKDTSSGTFYKAVTGAGEAGNIVFDMGSVKNVLVIVKMQAYVSEGTGNLTVFVEGNDDNGSTWYGASTSLPQQSCSITSALRTLHTMPFALKYRYIRIRVNAPASSTVTGQFDEVRMYELGA